MCELKILQPVLRSVIDIILFATQEVEECGKKA